MKQKILGVFLALAVLLALTVSTAAVSGETETASAVLASGAYDIYLTAPEDMTLKVGKGFADDGEVMTCYASSTTDGITTYHYKLDAGNYRFMTSGTGYYRLHKNFVVTAEKNGTTINADPGKEKGTGWEQSSSSPYPIYELADEVLESDIYKLDSSVYTNYPDAFSSPSFTNKDKTPYEFTTAAELTGVVETLDENCTYMRSYNLGAPDEDGTDIVAAVYSKTDLSSAGTIEEAAVLVMANGKPTVQVQSQAHGSEPSTVEGALGMMKSLAGAYGNDILEKINVVVIPRINTIGAKKYTYGPSDGNSDLNLDYYALNDKRGRSRAIVNVYNIFQPEVVIDMHEYRYGFDSTSGYLGDIKIGTREVLNLPQQLHDLHEKYHAEIFALAKEVGINADYYRENTLTVVPNTGVGNNFTRGSISVLLEIPGQRSGRIFWDRRVFSQYIGVKAVLDYTAENAASVKAIIKSTKDDIAAAGTYYDPENNLIVLEHAQGDAYPSYNLPKIDYTTGEYADKDYVKTVYKANRAKLTRPRPLAYVVSADSENIERVLQVCEWQNIKYETLNVNREIELKQYSGNAESAALSEAKLVKFPNGAYLFPMNQSTGVVLAYLMEPDVLDSHGTNCSFVQQGVLTNEEIYRCEGSWEIVHELTPYEANAATCTETGNSAYYLCACGQFFSDAGHSVVVEENGWITPATGHAFVQSGSGFECSKCGTAKGDLAAAVDACTTGGTVTATGDMTVDTLIVPADVTVDLGGKTLTIESGLAVTSGGAINNGVLKISEEVISVYLGDNGGSVPVWTETAGGYKSYALYDIAAKVGGTVQEITNGAKYAFGYKFDEFAAYAASIGANASEDLKFGVRLTRYLNQSETEDANYFFQSTSIEKMSEVTDVANAFFKVNLSLVGEGLKEVYVRPIISVKSLGFQLLGPGSDYIVPQGAVAELATYSSNTYTGTGVTFTSLEEAIAAAEAQGKTNILLLKDISYNKPTTIKVGGDYHFAAAGGCDVTISGPVIFDGEGKNANSLLFRATGTGSKLTLERGVTVQNYNNIRGDSDSFRSYGMMRTDGTSTLTLDNVTIKDCTSAMRGMIYTTGSGVLEVNDSTFTNNTATAQYGGVITTYTTGGVTVTNSTFTGNSAETHGGAICISGSNGSGGPLVIENSTFTNNKAGSTGGAIALRSNAMTLKNVTMSGNKADGVANDIRLYVGSFTLGGTTAIENISVNTGKSIALDDTFALKSSAKPITISAAIGETVLTGSNVAAKYTSFAAAEDGCNITSDGVYSGPAAQPVAQVNGENYAHLADAVAAANMIDSGTVYVDIIGSETFDTETIVTFDPNVQLRVKADVTLEGKLIIDGGDVTTAHTTNPIVILKPTSGTTGITLTLKGVTVRDIWRNTAYGATFRVERYNKLVLDGATITNNKGGIGVAYVIIESTMEIKNNSVISNNVSTATPTSTPNGGVIYADKTSAGSGSVIASDSTFSGNSGGGNSSCVNAVGSNTSFTNCTFTGNTGALSVIRARDASTDIPITNCTFTDNTTTADGAAVYASAGTVTVSGCTFSGNTKDTFAADGATLTVE